MKKLIAVVTLWSVLGGAAVQASAQDWRYAGGPAPYRQDYPVLKKLLIGGALVGIGFAAGRLTAPRPTTTYYGPQVPQPVPVPAPRPGCFRSISAPPPGQGWIHQRPY